MKWHFSIINAAVQCHILRTFEKKQIYYKKKYLFGRFLSQLQHKQILNQMTAPKHSFVGKRTPERKNKCFWQIIFILSRRANCDFVLVEKYLRTMPVDTLSASSGETRFFELKRATSITPPDPSMTSTKFPGRSRENRCRKPRFLMARGFRNRENTTEVY
jgi:hypothetical protein